MLTVQGLYILIITFQFFFSLGSFFPHKNKKSGSGSPAAFCTDIHLFGEKGWQWAVALAWCSLTKGRCGTISDMLHIRWAVGFQVSQKNVKTPEQSAWFTSDKRTGDTSLGEVVGERD